MKYCDSNIERYVRNVYYDRLNALTPEKRFVEKFGSLYRQCPFSRQEISEMPYSLFGLFIFCCLLQRMPGILHHFYLLLNHYADNACLVNIGGEEYNELSELLIECQKEFNLPAPILAVRITDETPQHIWEQLIDETLFTRGQQK